MSDTSGTLIIRKTNQNLHCPGQWTIGRDNLHRTICPMQIAKIKYVAICKCTQDDPPLTPPNHFR